MASVAAAAALLLLAPALEANREAAAAGAGAVAGAAQAARLFQGVVPERHRRIAAECEGVQGQHDAAPNAVNKMGKCVDALAEFARETQNQRKRSETANVHYHDDVLLAKKILRFLNTEMEKEEIKYRQFGAKERLRKIKEGLHTGQNSFFQQSQAAEPGLANYWPGSSGGVGQGSLMAVDARQVPMMGYQAPSSPGLQGPPLPAGFGMPPPPPWANSAAMMTPGGQNFGMPALVGRRPSLLQLNTGASGGGLQARLDREAESLEAAEAEDLARGDPDA